MAAPVEALRARTTVAWGIAAAVLGAGVVGFVVWQGRTTGLLDLRIYLGAVRGWAGGGSLYSFADPTFGKSATYPPFGLLVLTPLAPWPLPWTEVAWTLANLGALGAIAWLVAGPSYLGHTGDRRARLALAGVALAIPTAPVWITLNQGQVNLWLWLAILVDMAALRQRRRWAGVLIGVATAAKLLPGAFILFLVALRRFRAAGRAVLAALAATAVGLVLAPADSRAYLTSLLWDPSRVGGYDEPENNSLRAVLSHLGLAPRLEVVVWVALAATVLAVALARAVKAWARGDDLVAVVIVGCAAALVSPISWTHHLVFLVLALALLVGVERQGTRWALLGGVWLALVDPVGFGASGVTSALRTVVMVALVLGLGGRRSSGDQAWRPLASRATQTVVRASTWPTPGRSGRSAGKEYRTCLPA